jgi:hypothetical protein
VPLGNDGKFCFRFCYHRAHGSSSSEQVEVCAVRDLRT